MFNAAQDNDTETKMPDLITIKDKLISNNNGKSLNLTCVDPTKQALVDATLEGFILALTFLGYHCSNASEEAEDDTEFCEDKLIYCRPVPANN